MKTYSLNIAQAALAASLFLCCAEVPEEPGNPNNGPYSSSSLRQSSSGGDAPGELACGAVPSTAVEGMPVTKPVVLCDGIAVPAESWQPASLSWSSPEEGVYSSIKATATCDGQ